MSATSNPGLECTRCILRSQDDPALRVNGEGVCNHCRGYEQYMRRWRDTTRQDFAQIAEAIRAAGRNQPYDSILGISGGVDSSYVAYVSKQYALRPLAVHLDNGWDSELAVNNIELLLKKLDIDLVTHVISWPEFRDIQVSYLRASVVDIEAITDHAINACLHDNARRHGVRYILSGANVVTEGFLPSHWIHPKNDLLNLRAIHRAFGAVPLRTFPTLGPVRELADRYLRGMKVIPVLDHVPYVKQEAKEVLARELGWRDYGGKHYESVFTRFYQAYILPRKFGIDKRRSHLSTLICAGQMERSEALRLIERPPCDEATLTRDKEFVVKKLGLTESQFDALMAIAPRAHLEFASQRKVRAWAKRLLRR